MFVDGLRPSLTELMRPLGETTFVTMFNRAVQMENDLVVSKPKIDGRLFRGHGEGKGRVIPYDKPR